MNADAPRPAGSLAVGSKLAHHRDGFGPEAHQHPHRWRKEPAGHVQRLVVAPNSGCLDLFLDLASCVNPPYSVLYVLSVPRVSDPGRYRMEQSMDMEALRAFVQPYREFLEGDARHHLWICSHDSSATLVYDKHDFIYAYGPLECYEQVLARHGLDQGEFELPFPHYHNYFPEFDEAESKIIASHKWSRTGIVPGVDD